MGEKLICKTPNRGFPKNHPKYQNAPSETRFAFYRLCNYTRCVMALYMPYWG